MNSTYTRTTFSASVGLPYINGLFLSICFPARVSFHFWINARIFGGFCVRGSLLIAWGSQSREATKNRINRDFHLHNDDKNTHSIRKPCRCVHNTLTHMQTQPIPLMRTMCIDALRWNRVCRPCAADFGDLSVAYCIFRFRPECIQLQVNEMKILLWKNTKRRANATLSAYKSVCIVAAEAAATTPSITIIFHKYCADPLANTNIVHSICAR